MLELNPVPDKEDTYQLDKSSYLRKTKLGEWVIIRPVKVMGTLNWSNLLYGGKKSNIVILIIILSLLMFASWAYERDTRECRYLIENPPRCEFIPNEKMLIPNIATLNISFIGAGEEADNEFNPSVPTQNNDT